MRASHVATPSESSRRLPWQALLMNRVLTGPNPEALEGLKDDNRCPKSGWTVRVQGDLILLPLSA